jgi:hypothetical protein
MIETLTLDEMKDRFDAEWVLVEDPEVDEHFRVLRGKVLCHSKDRDEVYRKMVELRPKSSATLYFGTMPEGSAIVL